MADDFEVGAYPSRFAMSQTEREEFATTSAALLDIPYCPWEPNWICDTCHHSAHSGECEQTIGDARRVCRCCANIPVPSPQVYFLLDFGRDALYGGAAGGGKSIALLMAASQFLHVPGYAALLLRKSFRDLERPRALMDIAAQWWRGKPGVTFNSQAHAYTFSCPGGGYSQIVFGSLDEENDRYKYQGGAFLFIGFDELTQFKERDYTYLFSRMRRVRDVHDPLSRVPVRMRATCVDQGDVLTEHGWKPIASVVVGERVYSVDRFGAMSLQPVLDTTTAWTDEPLVRVRKKNLFMSITPNHRVMYQKFGKETYDIDAWDSHVGRTINVLRRSDDQHLKAAGCHTNPLGWDQATYLAFLGLFLAEGSTNATPRRGNYKVIVTQVQKSKQERIRRLFNKLPYRWNLSKNGDFQITNKAAWEHFRQFGKSHEKFIPRWVLDTATAEQLELLLDWMAFGDGNLQPNTLSYFTCSRQLADDVMEIGVKMGFRVQDHHQELPSPNHRDRYIIYLTDGPPTTKIDKNEVRNDVSLEPYSGLVHCITVANNESFVIRQQGKVWVSGNTNPGGVGHEWVMRRYITPWLAWKKKEAPRPKRRNFYPALIKDNPMLDEEDYVESLMELNPVERAQLMKGDWMIRPDGRMFNRGWFRIIDYEDLPGNLVWVRHWDMASTDEKPDNEPDYTAGALVGRAPNGNHYILNVSRWRKEAADNDILVRWVGEQDSKRVPISMEQEPGAQAKIALHHYRAYVLPGFNFRGLSTGGKKKIIRAGPVASLASAGRVFLVRGPWVDDFLEEVEIFPDGVHDDQVDSVSGAFSLLAKSARGVIRLGEPNEDMQHASYWRPEATADVGLAISRFQGQTLEAGDRDKVVGEVERGKIGEAVGAAWGM